MKAVGKAQASATEEIEFDAQNAPIALFFAVVPVLVVILIAVTLVTMKLPIFLVLPLLVVGGGCMVLAKSAIDHLGPVTLSITSEELVVTRLVGSASYPWSNIESVKSYDPGPTFSGSSEDGHAAIGIYLRQDDKKARDADAPPDVIVVARGAEEASRIAKAADKVSSARRRGMNGGDARRSGIGGKPAKGFRKSAAA